MIQLFTFVKFNAFPFSLMIILERIKVYMLPLFSKISLQLAVTCDHIKWSDQMTLYQ